MKRTRRRVVWMACLAACVVATSGYGARVRVASRGDAQDRAADYQAKKLLDKAADLLQMGEHDRGVEMLTNIIDKWPSSDVRYDVWLTLGKHYMNRGKWSEAVRQFRHLRELKRPDQELGGDALDKYLEGLYQTGVCFYQMSQYDAAFPVLRNITSQYPNTVWANQAYYYIGMCHFAKENWQRAIQALSLVGTFMDPNSPTAQYAEAGRRFYVKILDDDLPVLKRLRRDVRVKLATSNGDEETVEMIPLTSKGEVYIGSIATVVGLGTKGDDKLSVVSGDEITTTYEDENTKEGERNVPRSGTVKVVSSGALQFTLATFDEKAPYAYQKQHLHVVLTDADLDTTPGSDTARVHLMSRYRRPEELEEESPDAAVAGVDIERIMEEEQQSEERKYAIRDQVTLTLAELGSNSVVRTGRFGGAVYLNPVDIRAEGDPTDDALDCYLDDEVVATYVDEYHVQGRTPRDVSVSIRVAGEIDTNPMIKQNYVADAELKAEKSLIEGRAFLELGKIFRGMGLLDGSKAKCKEGIVLTDEVISEKLPIRPALKEEAFKIKWELHLTMGDLNGALAACQMFASLFPESSFVDQALVRIGDVHAKAKDYDEAIKVYTRITALPFSLAKAEAQFKIAQCMEEMAQEELRTGKMQIAKKQGAPQGNPEAEALGKAIPAYRRCAELYPESEFAGESLAKVVDYYVLTADYAQAEDILERVFEDYPDAKFIDRMLLKWVLVAFKRGDFVKAHQKCQELIFEYPGSQFAAKAKQLLPQIRKRAGIAAAPAGSTDDETQTLGD